MSESTSSNSSPKPDARDNPELPLVTPEPRGGAEPDPTPDPLAAWRAAREMEEEMADIFDEDRVTHQHGDTEPEAD